MVPRADHVRNDRRNWLYLPHKLVADVRVLIFHIVCEVANVENEVDAFVFGLLLQIREGLRSKCIQLVYIEPYALM